MTALRQWFHRVSRPLWERHLMPCGPFMSYLEIGTYCGDSLLWFAANCAGHGATLTAVDPWGSEGTGYEGPRARIDEAEQVALSRIDAFLAASVKPIAFDVRKQTSREFFLGDASPQPGSVQVAFVDGCHYAEPAMFDICHAWGALCVGGTMIVDDIHMRQGRSGRTVPHVGDAWDEFCRAHTSEMLVLYRTWRQVAAIKREA